MSFEIVTDSSANLTDDIISAYGIHILSLVFRVGQAEYKSYVKGQPTDIKRFYDLMRKGENVTTSHISMQVCREVFEEILKEGKDILFIGFSSALSGTYSTASVVAEELRAEYPERKILTVDSLCASMGEGLLVYRAALHKREGKSIDDVYQWAMSNRLHLCHWFTVDDLSYLKRGGRISAATAVVGMILGIKPVMHVDDSGNLVAVGKVRGRHNAIEVLAAEMQKTAIRPEEQTIFISHGDCIDDAMRLGEIIRQKCKVKDVVLNYVDPVIGAHSGPGTLALFFFGTKR